MSPRARARALDRGPTAWPTAAALAAIRWYKRRLSPWLPGACRFWPTCADYARLVIERHGLLRGGWAAFSRILRCQPMFRGGFDPPP